MRFLGFYLAYIVPISAVAGYFLGGGWTFLTPLVAFVILPALDLLVGTSVNSPSVEQIKILQAQKRFGYVLYLFVAIQLAIVVWGSYVVTVNELTPLEFAGFCISVGLTTGGIGITVAHELCHRAGRFERFLAKILLMPVGYMHFTIEHVIGHHVNVATPRDPATSRLGQSLYAFYPRTIVGSFASAWRLEARRLDKGKKSQWSGQNRMLWFVLAPIIFAAALTACWGWTTLLFLTLQAIVAVLMLEATNYIEHYGLERKEIAPGKYEKVTPLHSWNSDHVLSNYFLFQLQRHSDHHARPSRRYQSLCSFDESPQLPAGYPLMILMAFVPPLWRRVMDPRVEAFREKLKAAG